MDSQTFTWLTKITMAGKNPFYTEQIDFRNDLTTDPTINGQIRYKSGTGLRAYVNGAVVTLGAAGAPTAFTSLSDVPANYAADANKLVKVNAGETALEFVTLGGDASINATGTLTLTPDNIVNADIKTTAAIDWSKMAVSTDVSATGTVTDLTITGEAQGDVLYRNATNWVRLAAGAAGQALVTAGAAANPYWGAPSIATASVLANAVTCEAGATDYTIQFGVSGGAYNLTVPAVGGHRTFAFLEEAQAFTVAQTFTNEGIHILDTDATHDLVLKAGSNLTGDRILTITTGDAARSVTLTGNLAMSGAFNLTLTVGADTNVTLPATGTLATLAGTETLSGKTLTLPQINDTSADHQYVFAVSELVADRTVTLPLLTGADVFVFADFIQTLTNKTLTGNACTGLVYALGGNAITFQNAAHTVIGRDTTDTLTGKTLDCDGAGNVITNVNATELDSIAGNTFGVDFVIQYTLTNQAAAVNIFNANCPFKLKVIDAWSISTSADGGTWKLNNGALGVGTDLSAAITVDADDGDRDMMDENIASVANRTIALNGSLSIVPDAGGALDCEIFVRCLRID